MQSLDKSFREHSVSDSVSDLRCLSRHTLIQDRVGSLLQVSNPFFNSPDFNTQHRRTVDYNLIQDISIVYAQSFSPYVNETYIVSLQVFLSGKLM